MARLRHVDKSASAPDVQLKALGMALEPRFRQNPVFLRIDEGERPVSVADNDLPGPRTDANVVGVFSELQRRYRRKIAAPVEPQRAVPAARAEERVRARLIRDPLGFLQARDGAALLAGIEVDDADRVVAELGDEQAPPGQIDREVVDPTFDGAERDLRFDLKGHRGL